MLPATAHRPVPLRLATPNCSQAALMGDYGCATEPASELHTLLATGAVGGALQQYLTSTLGEPRTAVAAAY